MPRFLERTEMARIIVIPPSGGAQQAYALDARVVTVGRAPANQIVLQDRAASRKHCMLKRTGEAYTLVDVGSASGTVLNGSRLTDEVELTDGDKIKIGQTVLAFKED